MTPTVATAIGEARDAGLNVIFATGRARSGPWAEEVLATHGLLAPGVFLQGLTAFDGDDKRIHDEKLAPSVVRAVQAACDGEDVTVCAYVQEELVAPTLDARTARYATYGESQPGCRDADGCDPWAILDAILPEEGVSKLLVLCASKDAVPPLRKRLARALRFKPARIVRALDWTLEILPAGSSKAKGVRVLLDELGVHPSNVMAVGDGENDLEMLRMVGTPVAMGNAVPAAQKAARHVVATNEEDGVAQALREIAIPRALAQAAAVSVPGAAGVVADKRRWPLRRGPPPIMRLPTSARALEARAPGVRPGDAAGAKRTRREALRHAAVGTATAGFGGAGRGLAPTVRPALASDDAALAAPVRLSRSQITAKLSKVPAIALVNAEDAPFLTNGRIGYFFLDPIEALRELKILQRSGSPDARLKIVTLPDVYFPLVRGEQPELGGDLRLRPSRRQVVLANRALGFQPKQASFMPTNLDELKGQVPVFYSERVAYEDRAGGSQTFPFFLSKDDLDAAYDELQRLQGAPPPPDGSGGLPIGLTRIATLDGLVDQMTSGEVDLSKAVIVASRSSLTAVRSLVEEMSTQPQQ